MFGDSLLQRLSESLVLLNEMIFGKFVFQSHSHPLV